MKYEVKCINCGLTFSRAPLPGEDDATVMRELADLHDAHEASCRGVVWENGKAQYVLKDPLE